LAAIPSLGAPVLLAATGEVQVQARHQADGLLQRGSGSAFWGAERPRHRGNLEAEVDRGGAPSGGPRSPRNGGGGFAARNWDAVSTADGSGASVGHAHPALAPGSELSPTHPPV